jgi:hypothetical protein
MPLLPPVFYKVALHDMPDATNQIADIRYGVCAEVFASFTNCFVLHNDRQNKASGRI